MTSPQPRPAQAHSTAATSRIVLVGPPSPLRCAVACQLRGRANLLACVDRPARLTRALSAAADGAAALDGATVVLATTPQLPGIVSGLRHRFRAAALTAEFEQAVTAARRHGTARIVVLSTAFRYADDGGIALSPGAPTITAAETMPSAAAEAAACLFRVLGGDSVVLRLGWAYGREEAITRRVLACARRRWRLIDADPAAWIPMIAEADAARAVGPALTVPPGTYHLTDGCPVTQHMLNSRLENAAGRQLHSLHDERWGYGGALFGCSRKITDSAFETLTGWRPQTGPAVDKLPAMLAGSLSISRPAAAE